MKPTPTQRAAGRIARSGAAHSDFWRSLLERRDKDRDDDELARLLAETARDYDAARARIDRAFDLGTVRRPIFVVTWAERASIETVRMAALVTEVGWRRG